MKEGGGAELVEGSAADEEEEDEALERREVGLELDDVETWLMGAECFSSGLPVRSKKESAALATSSAVMLSTSFPSISLMRGGIVFSRCSLLMWSTVTSLVSSLS